MEASQTKQKDPLKIRNYSIFGAIVWTLLLAFMLLANIQTIKKEALNRAYIYTQVGFDKDVLYRRWVAEHGGVYVKIDSTTPPNPYLSHIPDRDLALDSNIRLTLLNPAYMTRQVYELQEATSEVRGHITSLNPIRDENEPDKWEISALLAFEEGATEYSGMDILDGKEYFRFMKPFITEASCLKCHAKDGYAIDDIRGGISIAYPMSKVALINKTELQNQYILYFILWIIGISGIVLAYFQLMKNDEKRFLAERSLKELNIQLEEKVELRSRELQKAQNDWQNIFNTLEIPAQLIDKDHNVEYVNDATLKVLDKKREELIGQKCHNLFHLSDTPPDGCPLVQSLNTKKAFSNEMHIEAKGTTYIVSCSPIFDADGNIEYFMHIMTDISDRKKMEMQISESKDKLDTIFKSIPLAVNFMNSEGIVLDCNESLLELHGYSSKDDIVGKPYTVLISDNEIEGAKTNVKQGFSSGTIRSLRIDLKRKDGSIFPAEVSSSVYHDTSKNADFMVSVASDIRKRLEAELQYKTIMEQAGDAMYLSDFEGNIIEVNTQAVLATGFSYEELLQKKVWELDREYRDMPALLAYWNTIKFGEPITFETAHIRKDGSFFPVELRAVLTEIKGKKAILGFARDISDRFVAKELLQKSEEKFRLAFMTSPDSVNINRMKDGVYVNINKGFTQIIGYTEEEAIGKSSVELTIWENSQDREKLVKGLKEKGFVENMEARFVTKSKEVRYGLMSATLISLNDEPHILSITRDITDRKKIEDEVKKLNANLDNRIKEMSILLEVSQRIIRAKELNEILQTITDFSTQLISLDSSAIYLVQEDQLYLGAATPVIPHDFPEEFRYANIKNHPHINKCLLSAQPLVIPDLEKAVLTEEENKILKIRNFKTLLYVPLLIETRAVGVLILGSIEKIRKFKKHEIDLFIALSVQSALTIENALLYNKSIRYGDNLEAKIQELTKAEKEIKNLNADLEKRIKDRTAELEAKNADLERINKLFIGRELRMAELKKEIERLKRSRE